MVEQTVTAWCLTGCSKMIFNNRHEGFRTPDLYRVNSKKHFPQDLVNPCQTFIQSQSTEIIIIAWFC
jgi:hypothetical protein